MAEMLTGTCVCVRVSVCLSVCHRFMRALLAVLQTDWSNRSYFTSESSYMRPVSRLLSAAIQVCIPPLPLQVRDVDWQVDTQVCM